MGFAPNPGVVKSRVIDRRETPSIRCGERGHRVSKITSKAELVYCLGEAAILEQQFMCQYLYAALSLKKMPDATCSAAQLERVRRWASTIYMIARQEMEHLSVVNSILTAVGGTPVFYHLDFPTQSAWLASAARAPRELTGAVPCDLPFLMSRLDLSTVRRFCCMESPKLDDVPAADRARVESWCFQDASGQCSCVGRPAATPAPRFAMVEQARATAKAHPIAARKNQPAAPDVLPHETAPPADVTLGTIQELYETIRQGLIDLEQQLGAKELFNGHPSGQEEIPTEYQIYLFPICNLSSALAAIRMVTQQGEGLGAPPGYDAHFQLYYDMAVEYEAMLAEDPTFEASMPVALDPVAREYASAQTGAAVGLWQYGYATLLYMLTGYYNLYTTAAFGAYPYLTAALEQTAFAPIMTMFIRSLGEVITGLPGAPFAPFAGVDFNLTQEQLHLLFDPTQPPYQDIEFYRERVYVMTSGIDAIIGYGGLPQDQIDKLIYVQQNMYRVWGNLQQIYQTGIFPNFNPNLPSPPCPIPGCD